MKWQRGKTSDGKPDRYYIESETHTICLVFIGLLMRYELYAKAGKKFVAFRAAANREEAEAAVMELKQMSEADAK